MGRTTGVRVSGLGVGLAVLAACSKAEPEDLSTEQLSAVINGRRPQLQECYEQALATDPSRAEVRMHAAIHIRPTGEVYKVELDEGGLPGMGPCLEQAIGTWTFPAAPDETHASLPLIFRPEDAETPSAAGEPKAAAESGEPQE